MSRLFEPFPIRGMTLPNRIVLPGFTDTHSHSYQGILRNILSNGRVDPDYNRDIVGKITSAYTPQDAYVGMLATALGLIDMGTTGVVDVSQVNNTPEHSDALIKALHGSNIRASGALTSTAGPVRLVDQSGQLVGIGEPTGVPGVLHPAVVLR